LTFSRQLFANPGLELSCDFSHCQPVLKTITDKNVQSRGVHTDGKPKKLGSCLLQGGSNMTGTDLYANKPHCAAAVRL